MKTTRTHLRTATVAAIAAFPLVLIGCSSSGPHHAGDISAIRNDPSPAMHTMAKRDSDRLNTHAYVKDTNLRGFSDDLDRVFFMDRPSRLHPGVKP